jgi:nucleoside-diphosphate-sugar epimerase
MKEQGMEVDGWVNSPAGAASLARHEFGRVIVGSVADYRLWQEITGEPYDLVVHCASSGRGGEADYEEVFLKGMLMINAYQGQSRRLFVSSTSLYRQNDGAVVTEESVADPDTATGRVLHVAEKVALKAGATAVRSGGIYGPGRGVLFDKFRRGEAVLEGDGTRWMNQIHRRDLVAAVMHLIRNGIWGEVYNATDDTPVMQRDYYAWCAEFLRKPMPPSGAANPNRKRGLTNKRVSNAKLRATGWSPMYPSFREGLAADHPAK